MPHKSVRLLLCRPQAGLTDILSQIGKCLRYADRFNRTVIVEMDFKGAVHFRDDFGVYFTSHDPRLVLSSRAFTSQFDRLVAFPSNLTGRINSYLGVYKAKYENFVDVESDQLLSFNVKKNYSEPLLLHHAAGGGMRNVELAVRRISVNKIVQDEVKVRMACIGGPFTSLHIRYTDFLTDYQDRILELKYEISGPIFLATDNRMALEFCRKHFGHDRVFNFATFPAVDGRPIHSDMKMDARTSNMDAICDVIMLAAAKTYYFFPLSTTQKTWTKYSGYSEFAQLLHKDQALFKQFFGLSSFGGVSRLKLRMSKLRHRIKRITLSLMPSHRR